MTMKNDRNELLKDKFKLEFDRLVCDYLTECKNHNDFEYFFGMVNSLMNESEAEMLKLYKAMELIYPDYFQR
jgi:hypothetical protein